MLELIDKYIGGYAQIFFFILTIIYAGLVIVFLFLFIPLNNIFFKISNLIAFIIVHLLLAFFIFIANFSIVIYPIIGICFFNLFLLTLSLPWLIIVYEKCNCQSFTCEFLNKFINNKNIRTLIYTLLFIESFIYATRFAYKPVRDLIVPFIIFNSFQFFFNFAVLDLWVKLKNSQDQFWNKFKRIITTIYIGICILAIIFCLSFIIPFFNIYP